ncbi:hypothetical protein ScPMuIL_001225 [Solemya velum]
MIVLLLIVVPADGEDGVDNGQRVNRLLKKCRNDFVKCEEKCQKIRDFRISFAFRSLCSLKLASCPKWINLEFPMPY